MPEMIWVDWCLAGVMAASIVIGIFRGFVREVFGLATWIVAFVAAMFLAEPASAALQHQIATPSLRVAAGYALVFFGALLAGSIITHLIAMAVRKSPLSGVDRTIGGGFGMVRGLLLALLFVWLAGKTPARQDSWWTESMFVGRLEALESTIGGWLPPAVHERLNPAPAASTTPA